MDVLLSLAFPLATGAGPMHEALRATEAPETLRAAFTVEMTSSKARRTYTFDPREPDGRRWRLVVAAGEDSDLDQAAAAWGAEIAPDGRLFPDDLRASLGARVSVDDLGAAWRLEFQHAPSANDTALDVWATQRLQAQAWLEPLNGRFLRIDYTLPRPVRGPNGGRLTKFQQSYLLNTEPEWGLTYISQFALNFEAKAPFKTIRQNYKAEITEATFFFASTEMERQFVSASLAPDRTR
ncbi:MAG: hypothetical protein AAGJ68_15415 [Pseudomonadota bacterium]